MDYTVIDTIDEVEVRQYSERLLVEVSNAKSRREAFMSLYNYISGENVSGSEVSMTTPVELREGEEIAMTTPVQLDEEPTTVRMRFFLPQEYTLDSAPRPRNKAVTLKVLAPQTLAVLRYSGSTSNESFREKRTVLFSKLADSSWDVVGEASFLGYDPPFTIPFLKRNEVIVEVSNVNTGTRNQ